MARRMFLDTFEPDLKACPIPPAHVERSLTECVHTPQPTGYIEWHEWARLASKTHGQVTCPHCGRLFVWLPKRQATQIRNREAKDALKFAKAFEAAVEEERKNRRKK